MINQKINKELLNYVRLYHSGTLIFEKASIEIIPKEFTHNYLLSNFDILQVIKEYYYSPCSDMLTEKDYQKFKSMGYVGNQKTTLSPYPFCYKGAFIPRKKLFYQLKSIIHSKKTYKGQQINKFIDLFPYFEDYSIGFKDGYNSFEEDCINIFLPIFPDKSDFTSKVFEYVRKEIIFDHSWLNNHSDFTISMNIDRKITGEGEIIKAYEDGKSQGYFYRAWSRLLSNSKLFENLFLQLMDTKEEINKQNIVYDVLNAAHTMQQNKHFWNVDEDTRTKQLLELLPNKYQTKDQPRYGRSATGKKPGSVDGVISIHNKEYFIEAFNLSYVNKTEIKDHIDRLEDHYDSKGLKEKFVVIYYNLKKNTFSKSIERYKEYIIKHDFIYPRINELEEIQVEYTNSRLFKTQHKREEITVVLYHILLMFPKE